MLLSIVIPTYNRPESLKRLLLSIIKTGLKKEDYEVIISDDSSIKYTKEIKKHINDLKEKINIHYYTNEYDKKAPGTNRQSGLNKASGEWIIFSDDDDEFVSDSLSNIKTKIEKLNEKIVMINTPWIHWEGAIEYIDKDAPEYLNQILTHGKIYRKDFIKKYNIGYPLDGAYHEDVYFNYQVYCYTKIPSFEESDIDINIPFYKLNVETDSITRKNKSVDDYFNNYILNNTYEWMRSYFFKPYSILKNLSNKDREEFYYFYMPTFLYILETILVIQEINGDFNSYHTKIFSVFLRLWKENFIFNEHFEIKSCIKFINNRDFIDKYYNFNSLYQIFEILRLKEDYIKIFSKENKKYPEENKNWNIEGRNPR